jgi:hypothetical protein
MLTSQERKKIRDEESFRASVRAASGQREQRGGFLKAINSPIFLWLLSTIVIGTFASLYTERKACVSSTEDTMAHFAKLQTEIFNRLATTPLHENPDPEAISKFLSSRAQFTFVEFDRRTLADLTIEFSELISRKLYAGVVRRTVIIDGITREDSSSYLTLAINTPSVFQSVNGTAEQFQKSSTEILNYVMALIELPFMDYRLRPLRSCSLPDLWSDMMGTRAEPEVIPTSIEELRFPKPRQAERVEDIVTRYGLHPSSKHQIQINRSVVYNSTAANTSRESYSLLSVGR